MKLRTSLKIEEYSDNAAIDYDSRLVFIGSCFTDNIGKTMAQHKFETSINPLGISYNPASLNKHIQYFSKKELVSEKAIFESEKGFVHFDFHSDLSKNEKDESIEYINERINIGRKAIEAASHIFISYGTAIVYEEKESRNDAGTKPSLDRIVNNCHKQHANKFNHRMLTFVELVQSITHTISSLKKLNEKLKIIFTLSPVRHVKNGLVNDRRSKSLLHAAIHELVAKNDACYYFPSYEIIVDELRDYRFYKEDMIHPSAQAIEYIWTKFGESFFKQKTKDTVKATKNILLQLNHKALHKDSKSYLEFKKSLLDLIKEKEKQGLNFKSEITHLNAEIKALDSNGVSGP